MKDLGILALVFLCGYLLARFVFPKLGIKGG